MHSKPNTPILPILRHSISLIRPCSFLMFNRLIGRLSLVSPMDLGPIALWPLPRSSTTGRDRHGLAASTHHALLVGWTLMTVAMMLPTTLPLLDIFRRLTMRRQERSQLIILVIAGYLGVWMAFGVAAHASDWGLHQDGRAHSMA